ncbi:DoxX family protein [Sphingomonas sp. KR3-1]|uniref:DoxX family protein n=1 Tax=Sphingomonas sp. KR3-1 TaxID=3156611 RepID=UPI0032B5E91E
MSRPEPVRRDRIIGWVLSGLVLLFLAMDAGGKLFAPAMMIANSPPLGLAPDASVYRELGAILAVCGLLYAYPRTAVLGAILLTGYLGGAIAMHFRVGNPLFSHTLFGVYLGVIAWGGLWFRDPRVRVLIPIAG